MEQKQTFLLSQQLSLILLSLLFVLFPLVISQWTSDLFVLPKQIFLGIIALSLLVMTAVKAITKKQVRVRRTPFDVPVLLFAVAITLSSFLAVDRYDSLTSVVPVIFAVIIYFAIVNRVKQQQDFFTILLAFAAGSFLTAGIAILSYLKVYPFPFAFTHVQTFTPLGSLIDQIVYLAITLAVTLNFSWPIRKIKRGTNFWFSTIVSILNVGVSIGLLLSLYELLFLKTPQSGLPVLPFETGFQTAFATISQDTGRTITSFLFGSGFGTYMADFTRFKQTTFNADKDLWSFTFFRSSSFLLELLATTGVLGAGTFLFLIARLVRKSNAVAKTRNVLFIPMILLIIASLTLPFSFTLASLFFFLVGMSSASGGIAVLYPTHLNRREENNGYYDADLQIAIQSKSHGLFDFKRDPLTTDVNYGYVPSYATTQEKQSQSIFPFALAFSFLALTALIALPMYQFVSSDVLFTQSFAQAAQNHSQQTFTLEAAAIDTFPYRDAYHRIFSQLELQFANSLAAQAKTKGASPSAQVQQNMYQLIQDSINHGRVATTISPQNTLNWKNLASIYRSLIGFGQNAQDFSVLAMQQAIALDPSNPQEYIALGGIYYQLGQWDDAQRQFQIAVNLKPDFANAYYNLGHALEQKGDLVNAKVAYQTVQTLVATDQQSLKQISQELDALQAKLDKQSVNGKQVAGAETQPNESALHVSSPSAQLPPQKVPLKIPPPPTASSSAQ